MLKKAILKRRIMEIGEGGEAVGVTQGQLAPALGWALVRSCSIVHLKIENAAVRIEPNLGFMG
ncbi:MAG: hypothetical protein NTX04_03010 [Verrucomicrobia bacterium]|nr:hypothetical protein [Verrucomicrobiota bacterium]